MRSCEFIVPGKAGTKGSTRSFVSARPSKRTGKHYIVTKNDSDRGVAFQARVAYFAREAWRGLPLDGAVRVEMLVIMARPKSVKATKRPHPIVKPDLDKVERALLDGMTGIVYRDDAQVCVVDKAKVYGAVERTIVRVTEMRNDEEATLAWVFFVNQG